MEYDFQTADDALIVGPDGRPMNVSVEYFGVLLPGAFPEGTNFAQVQSATIRDRSISFINGMRRPFVFVARSRDDLVDACQDHGVSDSVAETILSIVIEGLLGRPKRAVSAPHEV